MLSARLARAMTGLAVYLVRTHVNEAFDRAIQACRLQQIMSSINVVLRERKTVAEAVVNMRLKRHQSYGIVRWNADEI